MKNNIKSLIMVCLTVLFLVGCGQKKEENTATQLSSNYNLPTVEMSGQKVFLKYQFVKGEKFKYRLTTFNNSNQSVEADSSMKASSEQSLSYVFDIEVLDVDKNNIAELALTMSNIKLNATVDGKKFIYDSNVKTPKEDLTKFLKYEAENNFTFRAHVDQSGKIIDVLNIDKLIDKMITYLPEKQNVSAQQKMELANSVAQQEIKPITQILFRELTNKELSKDSTWKKVSPTVLGPLNVENIETYKLDSFVKLNDKKAAKITANLTAKWTGSKKGSQNGTDYNFDDPKVSGGGVILFDFEKGKILKSETYSNIEISVEMTGKDPSQKTVKAKRSDITVNKNLIEML